MVPGMDNSDIGFCCSYRLSTD